MGTPETPGTHLNLIRSVENAPKISALSSSTHAAVHAQLSDALAAELAKEGPALGLKPGDSVAVSSSVGQSISF